MTTQTRCRAKDPSTCKYHNGRILSPDKEFYVQQMEQAQIDVNFEAYGEAYANFKEIEAAEDAMPEERDRFGDLFRDTMALAGREKPASLQERALLFARVPNEVEGGIVLDFFKKHKRNNAAIMESKNPFMYRVVAGDLRRYQPNADIAQVIAQSSDHRARLLLAANMSVTENAVKGNTKDVIRTLASDPDPEIRAYVARMEAIATNQTGEDDIATKLANDPVRDVRYALADSYALQRAHAKILRHDNDPEIAALAVAKINEIDSRIREQEERFTASQRERERMRAEGTLPWYEDEEYRGPGSGYDENGIYHPSEDDS